MFLPAFMKYRKKIKGLKNFDIAGALLLGISLGVLVLVLDQGQSWGWMSFKSIITYIITAVSFIIFILMVAIVRECRCRQD